MKNDAARWADASGRKRPAQRILIGTCVGSQIGSTLVESLLAAALVLRGAQVEFLLCDAFLPACMGCEIGYLGRITRGNSQPLSRSFCSTCFEPAYRAFQSLGLPIRRFGELLNAQEVARCRAAAMRVGVEEMVSFHHEGLGLGEQARAGALRFFARGDFSEEESAEPVLRQYLEASVITAEAIGRLLDAHRYDCAVFNHGLYVPQGILGALCREKGIRVVNWNPAYRKRCFIFSHHDTYHRTMIAEPTSSWENMAWGDDREKRLIDYLSSRWRGTQDWIWFHERPLLHVDDDLRRLGVDLSKPCIGLLTSVMWDAALHYPSNAFPDMISWLNASIDYFAKRRDLQLIIRIHPAEIQGGLPSRQRVADEIRKRYPALPQNVFVIQPNSPLSTYAVMQKCNAVIIYNTKTGIELAAMGIPVIVAGEAWVRNKGLATDVSSPTEYTQALDGLPRSNRMSSADLLRAKKYAYHFFFRRMIPLEFMEPTGGNPPYRMRINNLDSLAPGRSPGLDLICDGILQGKEFIFEPSESSRHPASA